MKVLIETLWNVKIKNHNQIARGSYRINRNIVECKAVTSGIYSSSFSSVLIETLWNVKNVGYHMDYREEQVLIETLWNVKLFTVEQYSYEASVLIETLWNVKADAPGSILCRGSRINRNIVECKVA